MNQLTRTDAIAVPCPNCGAQTGSPCLGDGGRPRTQIHGERFKAAATTPTREHRAYDDNDTPDPDTYRHAIHPDEGRRIAYHACVEELRRRNHPLPEQRASELLKLWFPA